MGSLKNKAILGGIAAFLIIALITVGLYFLGGDDQSALERLRDIAIIFVVVLSAINVILLAAITAGLLLLFLQLKDKALPILDETTGTINRVRSTANFVTEEAVKPLINVAGKYSRLRTMSKVVTGKQKKPPKASKL